VKVLEGTSQWRAIHFTGDTQPLGNSVYDAALYGPGQGPNAGFGEAGVYEPRGSYREFRPVSTQGTGGTVIVAAQIAPLAAALRQLAGAVSGSGSSGLGSGSVAA